MLKGTLSKTALMVAGLMMAGAVSAKEMKIGLVDMQEVLSQVPQARKISETMQKEFGPKIDEVKKLEEDLKYNYDKKRRETATMSEAQKKELDAQIQKMTQKYEETRRPLEELVAKRQNEERNKLMALVSKAIEQVAAKEQYDLILAKGAAAYSKPENDISAAVVAQVSKAQ